MGQDLSCNFSEMAEDLDKTVGDVQRKGIVSMMIDEASKSAYAGSRLVKPGTPEQTGLPWRNLADQYLDGVMNRGLRRTHIGQIVFAGETIGMEENDEELLESEFELEEGLRAQAESHPQLSAGSDFEQ